MLPIWAAAFVVLAEGLVLWSILPILNYYCAELGVPENQVGLWVGALLMLQVGPKVILNPVFGRLSDRFGRRGLIVIASTGTMLGSVLWALAPNVTWLAVSRLMTGIFGAQAALASAVVADHTEHHRRSAGMGLVGAAFGISMVLGPLLGGQVTEWAGHAAIGWVGAAIQALAVLAALVVLPRDRQRARHAEAAQTPAASLFRTPFVTPLLSVTFLMTLSLAQVTTTFGLLAQQRYRFTESQTGRAFALFGLIGTIVQGGIVQRLAPRLGDRNLAIAGLAIVAAATAVVACGPPVTWLIVGMAVLGAGIALCMPTVTALLSRCVDPRRQGAALGWQQSVTALGRAVGAGVAGGAASAIGIASPYVVAAATALAGAFLLVPVRPAAGASPARAGEPPVVSAE